MQLSADTSAPFRLLLIEDDPAVARSLQAGLEQAGCMPIWKNTGRFGITPEGLPLLFNRFHRGRNVTGFAGRGIGLAIARVLVELHGGRITAERRPAGGARFDI